MALDPNFPTTPKFASAVVSAANIGLDGSGTIAPLLTAGANGGLVTSVTIARQGTNTATAARLFVSTDDGATWHLINEITLAAYTLSQTAAQTTATVVDKLSTDAAIRLPAAAKLGVTLGVAQTAGVVFNAEYMDY